MNNVFKNAAEVKIALPQGKTFVLVGGSFDLLHVGHLHVLEYAASLEDLLVVAVLSDSYTQKYKGPLWPVINQNQRARMLASLRCVDFVYISDVSPSSIETLELLKPHSVVFGEEPGNVNKIELRIKTVKKVSRNTKVRVLPRYVEEEISTSHITAKIKTRIIS